MSDDSKSGVKLGGSTAPYISLVPKKDDNHRQVLEPNDMETEISVMPISEDVIQLVKQIKGSRSYEDRKLNVLESLAKDLEQKEIPSAEISKIIGSMDISLDENKLVITN